MTAITPMREAIQKESCYVDEECPAGILDEILDDLLNASSYGTLREAMEKGNKRRRKRWAESQALQRFLDDLETKMGAQYYVVSAGFPTLNEDNAGTGIHVDRSHCLYDDADESLLQCWIPLEQANMEDCGLRIFPRFRGGESIYDGSTYEKYRIRKGGFWMGRLKLNRYKLPQAFYPAEPLQFQVGGNLRKAVWFNTNCLHQTNNTYGKVETRDRYRIAMALRVVREGTPLLKGCSKRRFYRLTRPGDMIRKVVKERFFS